MFADESLQQQLLVIAHKQGELDCENDRPMRVPELSSPEQASAYRHGYFGCGDRMFMEVSIIFTVIAVLVTILSLYGYVR